LTTGAARPSVRAGSGTVQVTDDRLFAPGGTSLARRFACRVLAFTEVRSLALDPARATAIVNYGSTNADPGIFLIRLADAVAQDPAAGAKDIELPHWSDGEPVTLYRHTGFVSIFAGLNIALGHLTASHPALARDRAAAGRVENGLRHMPGVINAEVTTELRVHFDPTVIAAPHLIRLAEAEFLERETVHLSTSPEPVNFRLENVLVGVAAVGEFVLPLMASVASGLLVLAALGTFGAAVSQLRERKIGLPLLYSCAVGARLGSGQFLAASLLSWLFRYWEYRYRQDGALEDRTLLGEATALPKRTRVLAADGSARLAPRQEVTTGQQIRVLTGEPIPVDGRVLAGAALVDQRMLASEPHPVRRVAGDPVLAGGRLLAGAIDVEALRTGHDTRVGRIARTLTETALSPAHPEALNRDAKDFAGRTVVPTLLMAGAGLFVGDLTTAAAILSPDYATGVGLAVPLERARVVKSALRLGAVIRSSNALERLASVSWVILDENPALHRGGCDVAEIGARTYDEDRLLQAMAAAGVWLGDARGPALVRACRARGLVIRRAGLREIDSEGVAVRLGAHLVRLRGRPVAAAVTPPPLTVEVDGAEVAGVRFRHNGGLEAAAAVRRLQRDGLRVCLISERPVDATTRFARRLGVDRHCAEMARQEKSGLLRDLRQQRVAAIYVGDGSAEPSIAREAHLWIALAGVDEPGGGPSDIVFLGSSIAPLPPLMALARDSVGRVKGARHMALAPNLLAVAGAFAFDFTAMAAVIISNLGTSVVYNRAKRSFLGVADARSDAGWVAPGEYAPKPPQVIKIRRSA
jgi:cation transport ATPase